MAPRPGGAGTSAAVHLAVMTSTILSGGYGRLRVGTPGCTCEARGGQTKGRGVNLVDPANPPSRKAPLVWALGAAIPWLVLAAAQLVWFTFDSRLTWPHLAA